MRFLSRTKRILNRIFLFFTALERLNRARTVDKQSRTTRPTSSERALLRPNQESPQPHYILFPNFRGHSHETASKTRPYCFLPLPPRSPSQNDAFPKPSAPTLHDDVEIKGNDKLLLLRTASCRRHATRLGGSLPPPLDALRKDRKKSKTGVTLARPIPPPLLLRSATASLPTLHFQVSTTRDMFSFAYYIKYS